MSPEARNALPEWLQQCLGCGHPIFVSGQLLDRCPECSRPTALAIDEALRIGRGSRGTAWLSWSMIAAASALLAHAWAMVLLAAITWLTPLRGGVGGSTRVDGVITHLIWTARALSVCLRATIDELLPGAAVIALLSAAAAMIRLRCVTRAVRFWAVATIVVGLGTLVVQSTEFGRRLLGDRREPWMLVNWSRTGSSSLWLSWMKAAVVRLAQGWPFAFALFFLASAVAMRLHAFATRRWIVRALAILLGALLLDLVDLTAYFVVAHTNAPTGRTMPIPTPVVNVANSFWQWRRALNWSQSFLTAASFALVGFMLTVRGFQLLELSRSTPVLVRRARWTWRVVVAISSALITTVALTARVPGFGIDIKRLFWHEGAWTAPIAVPLLLPVIAGTVHRSWRFAIELAVLSILATIAGAIVVGETLG